MRFFKKSRIITKHHNILINRTNYMKTLYILIFLFSSFLWSNQIFAQYRVGDYYVNANIKGIVFHVNNDEGTLYLLKTDMGDYCLGDYISWRYLDSVIREANEQYPYTVWDLPNYRVARLIHQNHRIISDSSKAMGFRILPRDAFLDGRVSSDGVQRLIPVFYPRFIDEDIFGSRSESDLLRSDEIGLCGILLYGIVDYRTGRMLRIDE